MRGLCKDLGWPEIRRSIQQYGVKETYNSLVNDFGKTMVDQKFDKLSKQGRIVFTQQDTTASRLDASKPNFVNAPKERYPQ